MKFMLRPDKTPAAVAGKPVDIYDFPDGRLEIRWKGLPLPYSAFDQLQRVSHAAIIENKRLGEVLAWIKEQQDKQPHHRGDLVGPRRSNRAPGDVCCWRAPCKGGAFQWVQAPPGNRSSRKQSEQSWR